MFYQKYKNQAFLEDQSLAQLNAILARFRNLLTTTLKIFIDKINGVENITGDTFLVTLDVKSLHLGEIFWSTPEIID